MKNQMLFFAKADNFDQMKVLFDTLVNHAILRSIECKVQSQIQLRRSHQNEIQNKQKSAEKFYQ
jgi:hypothetical protein